MHDAYTLSRVRRSCSAIRCALLVCAMVVALIAVPSSLQAADYPITPIPRIQGDGASTPMSERWVDTLGVVVGLTPTGFYLQDPLGDNNPQTSDGIFVYTRTRPRVRAGECVRVQGGFVSEFYEKTELSRVKGVRQSNECPSLTVTPISITLPSLYSNPAALLEPLEGMLVEVVDLDGLVHGPTKRYASGDAEFALLPGDGSAFVSGGRVFHDEPGEMSGLVYVSGALGARIPDLNWGDRVAFGRARDETRRVVGVLDYNFGKYQLILLPQEPIYVEERRNIPSAVAQPASDEEFTVCTFNLWGMGVGSEQHPDPVDYQRELQRRAQVVAHVLSGCTIIGLQEAGAPRDAANLAALLRDEYSLDYAAWAFAGPQSNNPEFPLTNAFLTRSERVEVINAELRQGCSPINYQVVDSAGACPLGRYPLHDRPPLVMDVAVRGDWGAPYRLRLIVNHWKSKAGDEAVNVVRRTAQARQTAQLVQETLKADPAARVIVLGDLNDYYVSEPVSALRNGVEPPLIHTYDLLPNLDRYTYIFNGASQVLDHILATESLLSDIAEVRPLHVNADFGQTEMKSDAESLYHASDHDPVLLRLRPGGVASLGGNVGFGGVTVALMDETGAQHATGVSDEQGDFRLWSIPPGLWTVRLTPPAGVAVTPEMLTLELAAGPATLPTIDARHQTPETVAAAALLAPLLLSLGR